MAEFVVWFEGTYKDFKVSTALKEKTWLDNKLVIAIYTGFLLKMAFWKPAGFYFSPWAAYFCIQGCGLAAAINGASQIVTFMVIHEAHEIMNDPLRLKEKPDGGKILVEVIQGQVFYTRMAPIRYAVTTLTRVTFIWFLIALAIQLYAYAGKELDFTLYFVGVAVVILGVFGILLHVKSERRRVLGQSYQQLKAAANKNGYMQAPSAGSSFV